MKYIKIIPYLFLLGMVISCTEDDSNTLVEPNHRVIVTSEMNFQNKINVNGHIDFGDLSRGVKSRTWTFPEGVASIAGKEGNTSSEDIVKAFFTKPGVYNVTLDQEFNGNVYPNENSTAPNNSTQLDTTIVVTVLDAVKVNLKAVYINDDGSDGAALKISNNAENIVTSGKSIRLSYAVEGEPNDFVWTLPNAKPNTITNPENGIADVKYNKIGSWDLQLIASRQRPGGADTVNLKKFVKVIPSTEPVILDKITDAEGKIALLFSREMNSESIKASDFSVTIETASEGTLTPVISSVSVNEEDGSIVLISLADEVLYTDDVVKVTYTPGSLMTLDGVAASGFIETNLEFNLVNILEEASDYDYSFENSTATNWPYMSWGVPWDKYTLAMSDVQAQDGSKSAYVEMEANGGMIVGHKNTAGDQITFPVKADTTYEIGVWVYVVDLGANDPAGFEPDIRFYWFPDTDWGVAGNPTFNNDFVIGEWVYSKTVVKFSETGDKTFQIRGFNEANSQKIKFYIDNLSVKEVSFRP